MFNLWFERRHDRGGHFAPAEVPELIVDDIRAMFRPMRGEGWCLQLGEDLSVFDRRLIDLDRLLGQLAAGATVPHVYPHSVKRAEEERPLHLSTFKAGGRMRSEARRVGKECVSTCRSRWSPYH